MSDSIGAVATASTLRVIVLFVCASILAAVGLSIWNQYSSSNYDSKQDSKISTVMMQQTTDYNTLSAQIVILNSTIYAQVGELNVKIMLVNTTIYSELDYILSNLTNIYEILNVSSGNASSFVQYVNNSLIVITGDINNLQMNVSNLYGNITVIQGSISDIYSNLTVVWTQLDNLEATKLETINGVPGDSVNKNVNLVSVNDNLIITPSLGNNTVYFNVPESLMNLEAENGPIVPNSMGQIFIVGGPDGLIDFNKTGPNTGSIDGTVIQSMLNAQSAAISTLSMQIVAMNNTINSINATLVTLENFIMNILNLNISGNLNVSIAALIYNVTVLQSTVVDLQNQIDAISANTSGVPVGTIVPFSGDALNNPLTIPTGYLLCDGSTKLISMYTALYNVILNSYCTGPFINGTEFCLPDLRGSVPAGQATSGTFGSRNGQIIGQTDFTIDNSHMPSHSHSIGPLNTNDGGRHGHDILLGPSLAYVNKNNLEGTNPAGRVTSRNTIATGGFSGIHIEDLYDPASTAPLGQASRRNLDANQNGILFSANTRESTGGPCTTSPQFGALGQTSDRFNIEFGSDGLCNTDSAHSHTTIASNTGTTGAGQSFSLVQPTVVINYIIKY